MRLYCLSACLIFGMLQVGCERMDAFSTQFGLVEVATLPSGKVYLKREARGLNFDQLAISSNGSRCTPANPDTDYIFTELGSGSFPVLYSTASGRLTVYVSGEVQEPKRSMNDLKIHHLREREYDALAADKKNIKWIKVDKMYARCP